MKRNLMVIFLKAFLSILVILLGIVVIMMVIGVITAYKIEEVSGVNVALTLITILLYFLSAFDLRKIIYSVYIKPFTSENAERFRHIGFYMFGVAVTDAVIRYIELDDFEILEFGYALLKSDFLLYLMLGFISLVLSEIFKNANASNIDR